MTRQRPPIRPPDASRRFVNDILAELAGARWSARGWLRFLGRSAVRSIEQARLHPVALLEVTALHAVAFACRPTAWPLATWVLAGTHLGLLGEENRHLGWANVITLTRANLPGVVRPPAAWTGCAALATDWTDGWLARRTAQTAFGGYADALADTVFWVWFVHHHDTSRIVRAAAYGLWLGPALVITGAYFVRGRAVTAARPIVVRNVSVALQVLVAVRASASMPQERHACVHNIA